MTIAPYYILYKANVTVFVRYIGVWGYPLSSSLSTFYKNDLHFTGSPLFLDHRSHIYVICCDFPTMFHILYLYFKLTLQTK